jgi:gas vesicle protein
MDNSNGKAIVGFIFGAAVGLAAGMLFAPRSGVETRKKLEKRAREYSDDVVHKVSRKIDDLKGQMDEFANETRAKIKKAADEK